MVNLFRKIKKFLSFSFHVSSSEQIQFETLHLASFFAVLSETSLERSLYSLKGISFLGIQYSDAYSYI